MQLISKCRSEAAQNHQNDAYEPSQLQPETTSHGQLHANQPSVKKSWSLRNADNIHSLRYRPQIAARMIKEQLKVELISTMSYRHYNILLTSSMPEKKQKIFNHYVFGDKKQEFSTKEHFKRNFAHFNRSLSNHGKTGARKKTDKHSQSNVSKARDPLTILLQSDMLDKFSRYENLCVKINASQIAQDYQISYAKIDVKK